LVGLEGGREEGLPYDSLLQALLPFPHYLSSSFKWRLDSSSTTAPVGDVEGMVLWGGGGKGGSVSGVVGVVGVVFVQAASSAATIFASA